MYKSIYINLKWAIRSSSMWFLGVHLILDSLSEPGLCSLTHTRPQKSAVHPRSCSRLCPFAHTPPQVFPSLHTSLLLCPPLSPTSQFLLLLLTRRLEGLCNGCPPAIL